MSGAVYFLLKSWDYFVDEKIFLYYLLLHGHPTPRVEADEDHDNQDVARYFQLGKTHHKLKIFVVRQFYL